MGLLSVFRQVRESAEAERKMRSMAEANQRKAAEMSTLDRYKLAAALDCDVDKITEDGRVIMDDPTPQQIAEWRSVLKQERDEAEEFASLQAQRKKERLTAAKAEVAAALNDVALHEPRAFEIAADTIENLIRTIVEDSK